MKDLPLSKVPQKLRLLNNFSKSKWLSLKKKLPKNVEENFTIFFLLNKKLLFLTLKSSKDSQNRFFINKNKT